MGAKCLVKPGIKLTITLNAFFKNANCARTELSLYTNNINSEFSRHDKSPVGAYDRARLNVKCCERKNYSRFASTGLFTWHISVENFKETSGLFQTSVKCHEFRDKTSPKRQLKLKKKCSLSDIFGFYA